MKILQLISSIGFFGAENVMVQLTKELKRTDDIIPVAGIIENEATPHREVVEICAKVGIDTATFLCQKKFDLNTIKTLREYLKYNKIDIIHSHGYKSNLYGYFSTIGLPVKRVATCHNWIGDSLKMKIYAVLDKYFLKQFNYVVAVSDDVQGKIKAAGIQTLKTKKIDNGIDICAFKKNESLTTLKNDIGIPEDSVVIGCVGRISEEKGHRFLLSVVADIVELYPKVHFVFVGDGVLRESLEKEYNSSHIIFTGLREDVCDLYQCMDIFVLPSLTEGLPMVLLEAMASGLPVVATRVGAIPTVVQDGKSGLIVSTGNAIEIKQAILNILGDMAHSKKMGIKGREIIEKHYSSSKMAAEYINIYQNILDEGRLK